MKYAQCTPALRRARSSLPWVLSRRRRTPPAQSYCARPRGDHRERLDDLEMPCLAHGEHDPPAPAGVGADSRFWRNICEGRFAPVEAERAPDCRERNADRISHESFDTAVCTATPRSSAKARATRSAMDTPVRSTSRSGLTPFITRSIAASDSSTSSLRRMPLATAEDLEARRRLPKGLVRPHGAATTR